MKQVEVCSEFTRCCLMLYYSNRICRFLRLIDTHKRDQFKYPCNVLSGVFSLVILYFSYMVLTVY